MSETISRLNEALQGRYEIERELGEGGMATVYLADDLRHGRKVAIKVLKPELAQAIGTERFLAEINTTANLQHPNILPLFDSGDAGGSLFYVMPYVDGETLRDRLVRETQLPLDDALRIATETADALGHAHARGVAHRDIKPENILLTSGHAIIADFGIARALSVAGGERLTQTGMALGTPAYASPEQASGVADVDHRTDIYALGCVLYEMLAGETPYTGPTAQAIFARARTDPVPSVRRVRAAVPASIDAVLARALDKTPADRFQSAEQLVQALEAAPAVDPRERGARAPRTPGDRTRPARWVAILVAVAAVGGGAWLVSREGDDFDPSMRAIAVMPFEYVSEDADHAYVADVLTEEITGHLSRIASLTVRSRLAAQDLASAGQSLAEIGEALNIGAVVKGTVRQYGDQLRVTAELIDVRTLEILWSGDHEGASDGILEIQRTVALELAGALEATLTADEERRLNTPQTRDPAAYALYERAVSAEDADRRRLLLEEAVGRDSMFALAWARLARSYVFRSFASGEVRWVDSAEVLVRKALGIDPELDMSHFVLGDVLRGQGRLSEAKIAYLDALELNPSHLGAMNDLSTALLELGEYDESLYWAERAFGFGSRSPSAYWHVALPLLTLDETTHTDRLITPGLELFPDAARLWLVKTWIALLDGDDESAERLALRILEDFPNDSEATFLATEVLWLAGSDAATARLEQLFLLAPDVRLSLTGRTVRTTYATVLMSAGLGDRAEPLLAASDTRSRQLVADGAEPWFHPYEVASIAALRDLTDEALDWLDRAYDAGLRLMPLLERDPVLDGVRGTPRFEELMNRIRRDVDAMRQRALGREDSMFHDTVS